MFYSEALLAKNGPLARVWLASNLDRKLSKQNVLGEKLESKVKDIIADGQAPMALRMSGQLLLGVVRIYSRKARYLLDDCTEALSKIKLAFRPGNVDLPLSHTHTAHANALTLPDTITELDLFQPLPDPEDLLRDPDLHAPGRDPTLLDFGTSQLLPDSQTPSRRDQRRTLLDDDDLGLDLGLEIGEPAIRSTPLTERSIEVGRRAPTPRHDEPSLLLDDDDLGLDYGLGDTTMGGESSMRLLPAANDATRLQEEEDITMRGLDDDIGAANAAALARVDAEVERRQRDSASPLSSVRSSVGRDLERTFQLDQDDLLPDDEASTMVQAAQRVKRRRVMRQDEETELRSAQIRRQQADTSAITKAPTLLPRDPLLLQLMEMQRNGSFVSNIIGDGLMQGWAPELRGILSMEVIRTAGEKKRKRDSAIADVETDGERDETPELDNPDEDDAGLNDFGANITFGSDGLQAPPVADADEAAFDEEEGFVGSPPVPFDITEAPLLHPSQSGPVSLGTKNAVHLLREHFAPAHPASATEPPTPSKRVQAEALFTDLCPATTTSRQDATKMFFELLVLATKDAVKVEQDNKELGRPIRVRGKRGLWGDWATMGAGGEIAAQDQVANEV